MADYPQNTTTPLFIQTWSRYGLAVEAARGLGFSTPGSITWPVGSTAFYIPMWIPWPYLVKRVFWVNGSSVASTNRDFGIYTADGTRIYSTGSTAASGTSSVQYVTPGTEILLSPGRYYFALSTDSTTTNRGGQGATGGTAARLEIAGILQEASALPLPATMTPAAVANTCFPYCGVTRTSTGF